MDAARVAFRQKGVKDVTMFYRRGREEMPAYKEEVEAGLAEGVKIEGLVAPVALHVKEGKLTGVRFIRNRLSEMDASGRQRPVPIPGSEFDVPMDTLIVAISEEPEMDALAKLGKTRRGGLLVDAESFSTDRPGVFAGGDVVTGPSTVISAVAAGKNAAVMIDRYVKGKLLKLLPHVSLPSVYIAPVQVPDEDDAPVARVHPPECPVAARVAGFAEVELSVGEPEALAEARRCLRCDLDFVQPTN